MATNESKQLVLAAAEAADSKKAEDIRILQLDPSESGLCDYFLICNGTNERQNDAISDEIELQLKKQFGVYANSVEGRRQAEWILMDYVDFIVHIFSPEKREFYGLERLRKSATTISVAEMHQEVAAKSRAVREKAPAKKAAKKVVKKAATKTAVKTAAKKTAAKKSPAKKAAKKAAGKKR